jgi:hypothetical protein
MSDANEERIAMDMRRRLVLRALLNILVACAVLATEFILGLGFHMITWPLRWRQIALVSILAALVGAVGLTAAWWMTRLPPQALATRITLRESDRVQRLMSRAYALYPLIMGLLAFGGVLLVRRALEEGWRIDDVILGLALLVAAIGYLAMLAGWGVGRRGRLIFDEELFRSFRTRGYVAGFWSVMAGLVLILALGLKRPAWAVEALPVLIAVGACVPAVTIALLNRRAERDG